MIITKTPFRMSFFGGGTDMPSFFRENGGSVLSTTFDKYCYLMDYLYTSIIYIVLLLCISLQVVLIIKN